MENYIEQIEQLCKENNIDPTEIVDKITRRFKLGQQAGMSEEDIIEMLGEPESYINKKENKEIILQETKDASDDYDYDLLEIEVATSVDLTIVNSSENSIKVDYNDDDQLEAIYSFTVEDKKIKLAPNKNYKNISGEITLYLPEKATYKDVHLSTINGDIDSQKYGIICQNIAINNVSADIENIYIKADKFELSNVSGDVDITNLFAQKAEISTVSGDIEVNNGMIDKLEVSSVNGDVNYNGIVNSVDTSTISGEININNKKVSKTIGETIKESLKDLKF